MTYSELPETLKLIYMTNFELFGKLFLLFIIVAWAFYYLWCERHQEKIKFILSDKIEILKMICARTIQFTLPLWLFTLFPQVGIDIIIRLMLMIYGLMLTLIMIVAFIGTIYYGPVWGLRFIGFDMSRQEDQGVMKAMDKYVSNIDAFKMSKKIPKK